MRIDGPPPPSATASIGSTAPEPDGVLDPCLELWALFTQMGDNFSDPSFDATSTAAYTFNDLISYWNDTGAPQPGTEDYILYYYLTQPDTALGYPSIESLCTPDPTTGVIPDENILELQKEFQDTDSYATNVVSLLSNPNDSHYYWTNVTYSYSWSGDSSAVQSDINDFNLRWKADYGTWKGPDDTAGAQRCAQDLNTLFDSLAVDGAGSPYTDLIETIWNQPLEEPPGSGQTGDSMADVCGRLATNPTTEDSETLWAMLVTPSYNNGASNNMNATFLNYVTGGDYYNNLTTSTSHTS